MKMWIAFCFGLLLGVVSGAFLASFFLSLDDETVVYQTKQAPLEPLKKNLVKKNEKPPLALTASSAKSPMVQVKPVSVPAETVNLDIEELPSADETPLTTVKRESNFDSSEAQ